MTPAEESVNAIIHGLHLSYLEREKCTMLSQVIRREIHDNYLNARFIAASAVSFVLILTSIVVLTANYREAMRDYQNRVNVQNDFIDHFGHYNRLGWMAAQTREPSHLQVLVLGIDREAAQKNFISNPVPALLSRLDFVSIVTIVMSLVAILFSYNAISGEREAGLLRQILAAGASRRTILIGKFIGGLVSLIIPFTISVLGGMIFLALSPGLQLQPIDFAVFGALMAASWLYIAVFFGIGLLFSARSHTSAQSVLKSLFAWVILVLVIPNISPFLAAQLYPIPSAAKVHQEQRMIEDRERDQILNKRTRELIEAKFSDLKRVIDLSQQDLQSALKADPVLNGRYKQFARESDELNKLVNKEQAAKSDKVGAAFAARSKFQENLAAILTSASPFSNFVFIATDLAETGIEADNHWERQAEEYRNTLSQLAEMRYRKEMEKDPAYNVNDYLDLRDRPRFSYRAESLAERMARDLPQWGVLVSFTLVFFVGALACFQKYDVR